MSITIIIVTLHPLHSSMRGMPKTREGMVTRMLGMARSMVGGMEVNMKGMISMVDRINISKRME